MTDVACPLCIALRRRARTVLLALIAGGILLAGSVLWALPGTLATALSRPLVIVALLLSAMIFAAGVALFRTGVGELERQIQGLTAQRDRARIVTTTDPVTGVSPRAHFLMRLEAELGRLAEGERLGLLVIDINRFKWINDTFGHEMGDAMLAHVGRVLSEQPGGTMVGRLGGDEFALTVTSPASLQTLETVAEGLRLTLAQPAPMCNREMRTDVTIGVSLAPDHAGMGAELLTRANLALHEAKRAGRRCTRSFTGALLERRRRRQFIEEELRGAIESGQLEMHYQPLVQLSNGAVHGVEALIRWRHPSRGMIPPCDFIDIAEESTLIEVLGRWILHRVCQDASELPEGRFGINVSPAQLRRPDFADIVLETLAQHGMRPDSFALEITENLLLEAGGNQVAQLEALRRAGLRVSLDDFGTGHSSLGYLREFPVDSLKIDKTFVHDLEHSDTSRAFVSAITQFGRALNISVIAEGVETQAQEALVRAAGCQVAQGYYYARPLPKDELANYLRTRERVLTRPRTADAPATPPARRQA